MGRLIFGKVLYRFHRSSRFGSFLSFKNQATTQDDLADKPLIVHHEVGQLVAIQDVNSGSTPLALQSRPKVVVLKVSMHCNGCARKVEKHISKMEGVVSWNVDLKTKMVVIKGNIVPSEVIESVCKVKTAELWETETAGAKLPMPNFL